MTAAQQIIADAERCLAPWIPPGQRPDMSVLALVISIRATLMQVYGYGTDQAWEEAAAAVGDRLLRAWGVRK